MKKSRWTRRKFLATSATGAATLPFLAFPFSLGAHLPEAACTLLQEQEEGPYYVDHEILRSEITEGKPGVPLLLRLTLLDVRSCRPIENAALDIWHCDALGVYLRIYRVPRWAALAAQGRMPLPPPGSTMNQPPKFGMGGPPKHQPTDKLVFLRGVQLTDAMGIVEFSTIFPGCYMGRTNHIHLPVHIGGHTDEIRLWGGGHVKPYRPKKLPRGDFHGGKAFRNPTPIMRSSSTAFDDDWRLLGARMAWMKVWQTPAVSKLNFAFLLICCHSSPRRRPGRNARTSQSRPRPRPLFSPAVSIAQFGSCPSLSCRLSFHVGRIS